MDGDTYTHAYTCALLHAARVYWFVYAKEGGEGARPFQRFVRPVTSDGGAGDRIRITNLAG